VTARKIATARGSTRGPRAADVRRIEAYKALFTGTSTRDDGDIVLADLLNATGFFRPPNYAEWMLKTKTPEGFQLHCALHAARAEPIRRIMDFLGMSDEQMIALEKAAREESGR
jgi:hypothetical protein